jgi:peroxiredoxin
LKVESLGYKTLTSKIFNIKNTTPLNTDFELEVATKIRLGPFVFYLPDFSGKKADVKVITPTIPAEATEQILVGKEAPLFSLPTTEGNFNLIDLRGSSALLTFIGTWSPPSLEQISILDNLSSTKNVVVSTQETLSKLSIFQKRGGYDFTIVVDEDGELIEDYNLYSLPTHYFLDRNGVIKKIIIGVLDEKEIEDILIEIR